MMHALLLASFLTPIEDALRHVLNWLHDSVGLTWAWSIVGLTVIVRMLLVPLTVRQIHSMQNLQRHAPEMKAIQQRYKHDRQKQNEEMMKFYRENNINPAASCVPMLAQFPIFIALYFVLRDFANEAEKVSSNLGDLSWLHFVPSIADKTTDHWSGYVLLAVYVLSQMASTFFMAVTTDKMQRTLFMILPVAFVFFIAHFPAGLVIYWLTTNLWTVGQGLITRRLIPKTAAPFSPFSRAKQAPSGDGRKPAAEPKPAVAVAASAPKQQPRRVKRKKKARR
jgi:YidC/Oxa1 family membrane protein insertase